MSEHMIFQNCSTWQKDTIRSHWSRKLAHLERLLQHFPEDQRELRLNVRRRPDRFEVRVVLLLPTGTLVATSSAPMGNDAIDAAANKLAQELRRHRGLIRHDDSWRRKRHHNDTIRHAAVLPESDIREPDRETFFEMLRPLMARLGGHVHHELIMARMQGRIQRRQLTMEDIRDDVILRAWAQFKTKDPTEPMEVWLIRLAHEALDEQVPEVPAVVSIDDEIGEADSDHAVETDEVTDGQLLLEEPAAVTLDGILPDRRGSEPWQELGLQEQLQWVLMQLSALPHVERRAFTLHLLDGWDPDEIAMIQGRSPAEVRGDIETVQGLLRSRLDARLSEAR
jgi:DNA-directed RNA polymerase specialized sigma24 family protein/ribosome-associated translation inhibitor RaiA